MQRCVMCGRELGLSRMAYSYDSRGNVCCGYFEVAPRFKARRRLRAAGRAGTGSGGWNDRNLAGARDDLPAQPSTSLDL
jgi:hypothetical protein